MKEGIQAEKCSKGQKRKKGEDPLKPKGEAKSQAKAAPKAKGRGRGRGKTPLAESPVTPVIRMKVNRTKKLSKADQAALAEIDAAARDAQNPGMEMPMVDPEVKTPKKTLFGDDDVEGEGTPHYEPEPVHPRQRKANASAKASAKAKAEAKAKATAAKSKAKARAKGRAEPVAQPDADVPARRSRKGRKVAKVDIPQGTPMHDAVMVKTISGMCEEAASMEFPDLKIFLTKNISKPLEHTSLIPYWSRCAVGVKWQKMPGNPQIAYFAYKDADTRTKVQDSIETAHPKSPDSWNKRMTACFVSARIFVPSLIKNDFLFICLLW